MNKSKIAKNYVQNMFRYDILAMISLIVHPVFIPEMNRYLRFGMNFFVIFKLYSLTNVIERIR